MSGLLAVAVALYFIPTIIAFARHRPSPVAITVVNLALGWTIIGWIAAFVWSLMGRRTYALR